MALGAFLLVLVLSAPGWGEPSLAKVSLTIDGFRNAQGKVLVALFNAPAGYPSDQTKAFRVATSTVVQGVCRVEFANLPHGEYAISVIHDENSDGRLELSAIKIPKEGVGASNNASRTFGPPRFSDARFVLADTSFEARIKMKYY